MNAPTPILMDVGRPAALPFPKSLPEFQQLFPNDAACAEYLEKARWGDGFVCPHCGVTGEPFRIATRPGVLACRKCRRQTGLTVGTVMERSHTPFQHVAAVWLNRIGKVCCRRHRIRKGNMTSFDWREKVLVGATLAGVM